MKLRILQALVLLGAAGAATISVQGQQPVFYERVPLVLTLDDSPGYAIGSDSQGTYEDGVDGVEACLDSNGNMVLNLAGTRTRTVFFDLSQPYLPSGPNNLPAAGLQERVWMGSAMLDPNNKAPLQNMLIGSSQCMRLIWHFTLNDKKRTQWRIGYRRAELVEVEQSGHVVVTRVDEDTWVLESATPSLPGCQGNPNVAKITDTPTVGKTLITDHGYYVVPFRLVATRRLP
ncbi:MAG: hypothetical protein EHM61_10380 [Acidobacteria bacterium]|nr:MAG: hypothetical protein EHM61_10380 [Acidobacteriota bacterium]